jgi:hypothetical protein
LKGGFPETTKVYGTDINGTIIDATDGNTYQVTKDKAAAVTPGGLPSTGINPSLGIASLTSPVKPGATASLTAQTIPGAACTIKVYTKSGTSSAKGLVPKVADGSGRVSWTWKVGPNTTPGTWRIVITAAVNGQTFTYETTYTVAK